MYIDIRGFAHTPKHVYVYICVYRYAYIYMYKHVYIFIYVQRALPDEGCT